MSKPSVTLRNTKGSPLTYTELDTNFENLRDATVSFTDGVNTAAVDLNGLLTFTAGSNISITVDSGTDTVTIAGTTSPPDLSNYVTLDGAQTITGSKTLTGTTELGPYKETVYAIGNSGTSLTPDAGNGPVQTVTANNSFTLNLPTGMSAGSNLTLIITQDGTGSRALTPNASYLFANGINTLSSVAGSIDIITIYYDGSRYLASLIRNYS